MSTRYLFTAIALFAAVAAARLGAQQNSTEHPGQYTQSDIEAGARLYSSQCQTCHGLNGDQISGIDLRRGQFKRSSSDEDLAKVITTGVQGTAMPPFSLQPGEVTTVIAFIRAGFDPAGTAVKVGNAARGRQLFDGKGSCGTCHRVKGIGPRTAPDLSDIGASRTPAALQRTLLDPSAAMMPINRPVRVTMKAGRVVTGRRFNEDTFTVQLIDAQEQLLSIEKKDIRTLDVQTTSPMPPVNGRLTADEVSDLIAYLITLKG